MGKKKQKGNGTGTVYPRKNKDGKVIGYRGSYFAPDGKRRYVSAKRKGDAERALRTAMADADRGLVFDAGNQTVSDYLDRWLRDSVAGSVKPVTFESYERLARVHLKPALGKVKLPKLSPAHLQGFYRQKLDDGLSPRTVQYLHVVLYRALKQALRWNLVPRNAAEAVDPPKIRSKEARPLSVDETRKLLEAAGGDRLEALYVLAVHTGMRQGELLGLRWEDVDIEAGTLRVRGTKTAGSRRPVKLSRKAAKALKGHLERQMEEVSGDGYEDSGLVFATRTGTPLDRHNVLRQFKRLLKRAGLPEIPFHNLRHTCATILFQRDAHPKLVQGLLGHASVKITMDTYSHYIPGLDDGLGDTMDNALD